MTATCRCENLKSKIKKETKLTGFMTYLSNIIIDTTKYKQQKYIYLYIKFYFNVIRLMFTVSIDSCVERSVFGFLQTAISR